MDFSKNLLSNSPYDDVARAIYLADVQGDDARRSRILWGYFEFIAMLGFFVGVAVYRALA